MATRRFPILFITSSRLGDAVLSSGLIRSLVDEIADARFTIVASPLTAPLFAEVPRLDRIIVMEKLPVSAHWFSLWRQVRLHRWGLVVDLRGSGLARALNPTRRAVHKKSAQAVHKVVEAARVLKLEETPPAPHLYTNARQDERAAALTAGQGPILAMAPAANWVGKTWPAERFAFVARALLGPGGPLAGGRLMVLGGPGDRATAAALLSIVEKSARIDLIDREPLPVAFAALRRARLFVGNDSGLMHLAAAAGAPTLGLFGPSDERLYAPWGETARVVRGARTFEEIRRQDPGLNQAICHMMELSATSVVAAARRLLAETQAAEHRAGEVHA